MLGVIRRRELESWIIVAVLICLAVRCWGGGGAGGGWRHARKEIVTRGEERGCLGGRGLERRGKGFHHWILSVHREHWSEEYYI